MEFENKKTKQRHLITDIFINQLVHIYKIVNFYNIQTNKSLYLNILISKFSYLSMQLVIKRKLL